MKRRSVLKRMGAFFLLFTLLFLIAVGITGCGRPSVQEKAQINIPLYQKMEYKTVEVGKGDLEPKLEFSVRVDEFRRISYNVESDNLELEKIHVNVGDKVKKGDVLISFKSGDIEETIKGYEKQLSDDKLLLEHYQRMQALEEKADDDAADEEAIKSEQSEYTVSIKDLKREMELLKVRIAEEKEKLKGFSITAEEDGTISFMDENLNFGYVLANTSLVSQTCGSEYYEAVVKDDYDFQIGDVFVAVSGVAEYEMELISVENNSDQTSPASEITSQEPASEETETSGSESEPDQTSPASELAPQESVPERTLLFRPKQDMSGVSEADTFTVTIK
ncbi:MAG: hypothetical protein K2G89_09735, partial [Lachnospiraceae bacterium]|nr:hypothetical protein [Lachnospiraceae bacterium]